MLKFIGEIFVLYLLYKVIVDIIIPIASVSKKAKNMMDEMYRKEQSTQQANTANNSTTNNSSSKIEGEYIDYEEVK